MDMLIQNLEFPCPESPRKLEFFSRMGGIIRWRSPRHRLYQHQRVKPMIKAIEQFTFALIVGGMLAGCAAPGPQFSSQR